MTWEQLPWRRARKGAIEVELADEMSFVPNHNVYRLPKGTKIKISETRNFGWVILPQGTKDISGHVIPYRIMRI
jgi:hypothetical protein